MAREARLLTRIHPLLTVSAQINCICFSEQGLFYMFCAVRNGLRSKSQHSKAGSMMDYYSDTDRTRSVSPADMQSHPASSKPVPGMRINTLLNEDEHSVLPTSGTGKGPGRGNWGRNRNKDATAVINVPRLKSKADYPRQTQTPDASSPNIGPGGPTGPHGFYLPLNGTDPTQKRSRPLTAHQVAIERYRKERVDYILDRRLRFVYEGHKEYRGKESAIIRAWRRCAALPDGYDTDEDEGHRLPGGFATLGTTAEPSDFGEEVHSVAQALRRAARRLDRWDGELAETSVGSVPSRRSRKKAVDSRREQRWYYPRRRAAEAKDEAKEEEPDGDSYIEGVAEGLMEIDGPDEELDDIEREMLEEVDADDTDEEDNDQTMVDA